VLPLNGTWRDASGAQEAPFFFPDAAACDTPRVPTEGMLRECLEARGGRLYFMGNSFARGTAFALQAFLARARGGGAEQQEVPRAEQIRLCPKHIDWGNPLTFSCELPLQDAAARAAEVEAAANASAPARPPLLARVLWRHVWAGAAGGQDFCSGQPSWRGCYAAFFGPGGGGRGDVLFSNVGRGYAEHAAQTGRDFFAAASMEGLLSDADAFLSSGVFNGTVVWTTATQADPHFPTWASFNPHMAALNAAVAAPLAARGVVVVDQAHFWERGLKHNADRWVDGIHPPEEAYLAAFFLGMSAVCGW